MEKQTACICENKGAFVFATRIVQFLFYLNLKFQVSGSFLCLYRSICVGPVRKPHCWFSHEAAQIILIYCRLTDKYYENSYFVFKVEFANKILKKHNGCYWL